MYVFVPYICILPRSNISRVRSFDPSQLYYELFTTLVGNGTLMMDDRGNIECYSSEDGVDDIK